jgi:leucyl-tRNA synthetase
MAYNPQSIEPKWQAYWAEHETFRTPNPGEPANGKLDPAAPPFYVLDMFPYPSGVGLHVGHPLGYIATDIAARYLRMTGKNVLHPMGFDAFGLPAEQFAIEHNVHPADTTRQNVQNMVGQLKRLGLGYDWSRTISTTDPTYYRWTQWIFIQLYESYFDPAAKAARPISELVRKLEGEDYLLDFNGGLRLSGSDEDLESITGTPIGVRKWHELDPEQQRHLLDEYRLAYLAEVEVNWCPALGTVLANEEVTADGRSERGNHPVSRRPLKQWMLRITAFADRLLDDLDMLDWPEPIKLLQRNWIGRSEGAFVDFAIQKPTAERSEASDDDTLRVFTTRPDTLFGATYMVLAPEHPLVDVVTTDLQRPAVQAYRDGLSGVSDRDRNASAGKTGVFTGGYAINPVNEQKVPIWIADYVMMGYGTGAIMAVPAHDQRDFDFAALHDLPVVQVVQRSDTPPNQGEPTGTATTGPGTAINSGFLNGMPTAEAKARMIDWLENTGSGRRQVQTKLRDWLFSRQRYWGEPFPILHELDDAGRPTGRTRSVPEADLPVNLPEMTDFRPEPIDDPDAEPRPPLARAGDEWQYVQLDGKRYRRELNTMPQWAGSCWYYLRYLDPHNHQRFVGQAAEQYWMHREADAEQRSDEASGAGGHLSPAPAGGVDLYVGGVEHAVLHLLYARFWHKVLYDLGHVSTPEPFGRLFSQGYIQAYAYTDSRGVYVPAEEVEQDGEVYRFQGDPVTRSYGKMGKSLKNAVAPDDVIAEYGADTLRLYEMYLGPLDASKPWNTQDIVGVHRFLQRVWRNLVADDDGADGLLVEDAPASDELRRQLHQTIAKVSQSMQSLSFNVAIAAMIEFNNTLVSLDRVPREAAEALVRLLAPFAPHTAEELWHRLGHQGSVADADWPTHDPSLLVSDTVELPVQVNGKLRGKVTVPADADDQTIESAACTADNVAEHLAGKTVRKVVIVKGRLVNLVVG